MHYTSTSCCTIKTKQPMRSIYLVFITLLFSAVTFAQTSPVKGKVFDSDNKAPLAGASIVVAGKTVAVSDKDGLFNFNCSGATTITASFKSYETYSQKIADCSSEISIALVPSYHNLGEV